MIVSELMDLLTALPQDATIKQENKQYSHTLLDELDIQGIKQGYIDKEAFVIYAAPKK